MKCGDVYLHICDHLDEDLASPRCRQIKRHLDECPNCRAYLDSLKKTIVLYRALPEPSVPAETHRELFRTIALLTASPGRKTGVKSRKARRSDPG
jgi:anti-sigma factor RsiW